MHYAIKTPDGLGLFRVVLDGALPDGPLPAGKTPADCDMWPVEPTIPAGFRQDVTQGTPRGWQLVAGVVSPILAAIPVIPPTPQQIWRTKLAGRITDSATGIQIEASEAVRNLLTGQLVMVTTALQFGLITAETPQSIWDADSQPHTLTTTALIALILRHGAAWQAMFVEFAP